MPILANYGCNPGNEHREIWYQSMPSAMASLIFNETKKNKDKLQQNNYWTKKHRRKEAQGRCSEVMKQSGKLPSTYHQKGFGNTLQLFFEIQSAHISLHHSSHVVLLSEEATMKS